MAVKGKVRTKLLHCSKNEARVCLRGRKQTQAATLIHNWRPWEKSTGPKTPEGKRRSAMRGYKGGHWKLAQELSRALREQKKAIHNIDT